MEIKLKNYLRIALILAALAFAYGAVSYVKVYRDSVAVSSPSFTVNGEGKSVAIPDVATFSFSVVTEGGTDISALQTQNTERANDVIAFLKDAGVTDDDIQTQQYNVEPRQQYFSCFREGPCKPSEIVGYTIRNTVSVKVRDLNKVGDIFSGVVDNGANSVSQLTFTVDDRAELESDARAKAFTDAENKAKAVADAGDFRLGRLLSIDSFDRSPSPMFGVGGGDFFESAAIEPTIEPGSEEVVVNVILRYEIR